MLLLDEPMAGINPTLGARLLEHMHQLRAERGMTFLFIEHDMEVVMGQSDKVIEKTYSYACRQQRRIDSAHVQEFRACASRKPKTMKMKTH